MKDENEMYKCLKTQWKIHWVKNKNACFFYDKIKNITKKIQWIYWVSIVIFCLFVYIVQTKVNKIFHISPFQLASITTSLQDIFLYHYDFIICISASQNVLKKDCVPSNYKFTNYKEHIQ